MKWSQILALAFLAVMAGFLVYSRWRGRGKPWLDRSAFDLKTFIGWAKLISFLCLLSWTVAALAFAVLDLEEPPVLRHNLVPVSFVFVALNLQNRKGIPWVLAAAVVLAWERASTQSSRELSSMGFGWIENIWALVMLPTMIAAAYFLWSDIIQNPQWSKPISFRPKPAAQP